jgi:hypothetical protein
MICRAERRQPGRGACTAFRLLLRLFTRWCVPGIALPDGAVCAPEPGNASVFLKYALRVRRESAEGQLLAALFANGTTLVPAPASVPSAAGSVTVADRLAEALLQQGLGIAVWAGLRRCTAVRKSATADAGNRPTVADHFHSFAVIG